MSRTRSVFLTSAVALCLAGGPAMAFDLSGTISRGASLGAAGSVSTDGASGTAAGFGTGAGAS
ncbi:hypothetical protein, partial [Inquilinus limosus]